MNTVEVEETPKQRKQRVKDKDKVPVPSGPTSLNPGTWLTNEYENLQGADLTTARSEHIIETLLSYHPGPRYRQLWEPTFSGLRDVGFRLENTATSYGEADVAAIREQVEDSPSFSMMGTPNVLTGVNLLMYREQKRREQELEEYKPKPKRKTGKKAKKETPKPKLRLVTMDQLETRYRTWFDDQTEDNWSSLWDDAHALFTRLATRDSSEDGRKLREAERDVELVNDFLLSILTAIKSGDRIDKFKHYISRAWKRRRIDALKDLKEWNRKHVRDVPSDDEVDEDERVTSYADSATFHSWHIQQRDTPEPTDEERQQQRESKLNQIDADLADFTGLWLTGASERELSSRFRLSRQAVGRRKRKVEKALALPAAVEVSNV